MNFARNMFAAAALFGVVVMANVGSIQAEDLSNVKTIKPLYAASFDMGAHHVLSYFLKKGDRCDLSVFVTERPAKEPEGLRIAPLLTTKFKAEINGGGTRTIGFDPAEGRMLEYGCAPGAQAMTIRKVYPVADIEHPPLYSYEYHKKKVPVAAVGG